MANVNVNLDELSPQAGADSAGRRVSFVASATKAAQNDTLTFVGATSVVHVALTIDATGVSEPTTKATNVVTLTSVTTGAVSGTVIFK